MVLVQLSSRIRPRVGPGLVFAVFPGMRLQSRLGGKALISLQQVDPSAHRETLKKWLYCSHVARWWGDPVERIRQLDETLASEHAIIELDETPIGYIRWQTVDRETLDAVGLDCIPDGAIDIDLFIGQMEMLGRGLAAIALNDLIQRLVRETTSPLAGLCTSIENHRAIRAFEKAGFQKRIQYDDPTYGRCWVLVRPLR